MAIVVRSVVVDERSADGHGRGWSGLRKWWSWLEWSETVVIVVEQPRSWAMDFGYHRGGFGVSVAARSGQVPRPGLTEIDPWGPVLLGVCVCVSVGPVC